MYTFIMFGKYSPDALKEVSEQRTRKVVEIAERFEGRLTAMYALLGAYDLIMIGDFPDMSKALQASIAITSETGISFSTLPAMPVAEFDQLVAKK
ncbi:MAG: GYD domain-containing protein [Deferribacteres bacterium]|nr:GYD domain-containing protein [candidate division KSB1 bacterium]MCB9511224.1 GYD domain-containing protein [Deferribacteres bacterium]